MKIIKSKTGIYFKLDPADFKSDWKIFLHEIKKLPSAVFNPAELDEENHWFIGVQDFELFFALKKIHIDQPLKDIENYKSIGFRPIPRPGGKFAKPKLKY